MIYIPRATFYLRPLYRRQKDEHLVLASDGHTYVVNLDRPGVPKASLMNFIGGDLCRLVGIDAAMPSLLTVDPQVLQSALRINGSLSTVMPVLNALHLGIRYPVDPRQEAIYDFLPDSLLERVENRDDFWKLIPIDLWLGNSRASKLIYYRSTPQSSVEFRATTMFRLEPGLLERQAMGSSNRRAPILTSRHYCGAAGRSIAENVLNQILALTVSDIQNLFFALPTPIIERHEPLIKEIAQELVAERDARTEGLSRILKVLELGASAEASRRKPPAVELIGTNPSTKVSIAAMA